MRYIKKIIIYPLLLVFIIPFSTSAAMQSSNYIIYENVMHAFDGPVISLVTASVSGLNVTVTWTTNVNADGFVIYDTDPGLASSMEQGNSAKTSTAHSVALSGLSANTTYYYQVRSERVNGGITTDTTIRSFTTGSAPGAGEEEEAPPSGSGGILIIDKTDKEAPIISNVAAASVSATTIQITWETDEEATSFVEYGITSAYGSTYGNWASTTEHSVVIERLIGEQQYFYRVLSSDSWGNVGYSEGGSFITGVGEVEEGEEPAEIQPETEVDVTQRIFDFIGRLFPEVSLNLTPEEILGVESFEDLESLVNAPVLSGQPRVEVRATEATIYWTTDIEANSQVAIAPTSEYNAGADEPYLQAVGSLEEFTTEHEVTIYGLTPDTEYHYQLRSKAAFGPTSRSRDFTFTTTLEEFVITSFFSQIIDAQTAVFKWVTNKESDSAVTFSPYRGNVLAIDQAKTIKDNEVTIIHEITISEFTGGTFYDVEIESVDADGNVAAETFERFSTAEDDLPPELSHIQADSTVFLDRGDKIQTIISWLTNEPATSRVYYQEGVHGLGVDLVEATALNTDYSKEHVMVVTKFKPGLVYTFRVESIDSGGNTTLSKPHTFMTAKKRESIIDMILRILEETFGWIKKIV